MSRGEGGSLDQFVSYGIISPWGQLLLRGFISKFLSSPVSFMLTLTVIIIGKGESKCRGWVWKIPSAHYASWTEDFTQSPSVFLIS